MLIVPIPNPSHPRCNLFNDPHLSGPVQQRQRQVPTSSHAEHCSQQEGKGRRARTRGGGSSKISPRIFSTLTFQSYLLQTCDPENYANPVSVSTTPYTGDGAGVGLAESGDAHPTPATPLSSGASSVCVKPNEPNPDLTDCSQVRQRLRKICSQSLVQWKICHSSPNAHLLATRAGCQQIKMGMHFKLPEGHAGMP